MIVDNIILQLEPQSLFFKLKHLSDEITVSLKRMLLLPGLLEIRLDNITFLLCLINDALKVNEKKFITDVFLPWHAIQKKTSINRHRVFEELARFKDFKIETTPDRVHAVNIYRSIVADLFDPYISLIVACYQFIEGTYSSVELENLSQGERNKNEFILARDKNCNLLKGYDPIVRNAISHAGSHGVEYREASILFRNIKRDSPPKVEIVEWSFDELDLRIMLLIESILSIDVVINIIGIDHGDLFLEDYIGLSSFLFYTTTIEQRTKLRFEQDSAIERILYDESLANDKKLSQLEELLKSNLSARNMAVAKIHYDQSKKEVTIFIPVIDKIYCDKKSLLSSIARLPRYAILARSVFKDLFNSFRVSEIGLEDSVIYLEGIMDGVLLDEYGAEKAGLIDILSEASFLSAGEPLKIHVDFSELKKQENVALNDPFPRKKRSI
ncbi:MAG: hypothetical protein ACOYXC_09125 [Candidatus Rifleibacteriota bacterium]